MSDREPRQRRTRHELHRPEYSERSLRDGPLRGGAKLPTDNEYGLRRIGRTADTASSFAQAADGRYRQATNQRDAQLRRMRALETELGQDRSSIANERLRQGLQQNLAAQAAGGDLRSAMMGARRGGSELAAQGARDRLSEAGQRRAQQMQALQALSQYQMAGRGQDLDMALRAREQELGGYQGFEEAALRREMLRRGLVQQNTDRFLGAMQGGMSFGSMFGGGGGGGANVSQTGPVMNSGGSGSLGTGYASPIAGSL